MKHTLGVERSGYLKGNWYKGIKIEVYPAVQYPLNPDINYRAEGRYLYVEDGWSYEHSLTAYGYSESEAESKLMQEIDRFFKENL